jgi:hypothetical protein
VSASSPDPRFYKDGNGLRPTWRLWLRHPIFALRFTPFHRVRIWWKDRKPRQPVTISKPENSHSRPVDG